MMGRPVGSKNKVHVVRDDDDGEVEILRNTIDGDELLAYIRRIEACDEEQKAISSDRQQVFKELKQAGYNRDTVREIVKRRKMTKEERQTAAALLDQYMSALGDFSHTPLGQAGADRIREAQAI